jgi:RNA polymerase sigma-70 factor (ECF subfamily)
MTMPGSDRDLVQAALRGRTVAFEALVRRHLRAAYAVALARTGSPHDAEDVCQDAFVAALERLATLRDPDRFAPWLLEIVRNRALNLIRSRRVRSEEPIEAADERGGGPDPGREAERSALREDLLAALAALDETRREVTLLHDVEGWRHAEIAERLGMPEGTVRYHLHEARKTLRERLAVRYGKELNG